MTECMIPDLRAKVKRRRVPRRPADLIRHKKPYKIYLKKAKPRVIFIKMIEKAEITLFRQRPQFAVRLLRKE